MKGKNIRNALRLTSEYTTDLPVREEGESEEMGRGSEGKGKVKGEGRGLAPSSQIPLASFLSLFLLHPQPGGQRLSPPKPAAQHL